MPSRRYETREPFRHHAPPLPRCRFLFPLFFPPLLKGVALTQSPSSSSSVVRSSLWSEATCWASSFPSAAKANAASENAAYIANPSARKKVAAAKPYFKVGNLQKYPRVGLSIRSQYNAPRIRATCCTRSKGGVRNSELPWGLSKSKAALFLSSARCTGREELLQGNSSVGAASAALPADSERGMTGKAGRTPSIGAISMSRS